MTDVPNNRAVEHHRQRDKATRNGHSAYKPLVGSMGLIASITAGLAFLGASFGVVPALFGGFLGLVLGIRKVNREKEV